METLVQPEITVGDVMPISEEIKTLAWLRPLVWAAGIILLFGLFWQGVAPAVRESNWHASESIGSVMRKAGGELSVAGLDIQLTTGDYLEPGEYELAHGMVQYSSANEVEVLVEAPARFRLDSPMLMALHEGRLSANVPPQGIGFTVETPGSDVVDHGTEFGVEVDSKSQSEIHVFEGAVEVKSGSLFWSPFA